MKTLQDQGELDLLEIIKPRLPKRREVKLGAGDDCAVVDMSAMGEDCDMLMTSDSTIRAVHFSRDTPLSLVGRKALARALSDIAAMGGTPIFALVDLVAPSKTRLAHVVSMYNGICKLASRHRMAVVGGDTSRGPELELHVFATGTAPRGRAVPRSGARPGHAIYVTGALGGSRRWKHLRFQPRLAEGEWLMQGQWAKSMIDISDGLATDLRHIMKESGVGATLFAENIPVSAAAKRAQGKKTPLTRALSDGEDFELLFTVEKDAAREFEREWRSRWKLRCSRIGRITGKKGVLELAWKNGKKEIVEGRGFQHFQDRRADGVK